MDTLIRKRFFLDNESSKKFGLTQPMFRLKRDHCEPAIYLLYLYNIRMPPTHKKGTRLKLIGTYKGLLYSRSDCQIHQLHRWRWCRRLEGSCIYCTTLLGLLTFRFDNSSLYAYPASGASKPCLHKVASNAWFTNSVYCQLIAKYQAYKLQNRHRRSWRIQNQWRNGMLANMSHENHQGAHMHTGDNISNLQVRKGVIIYQKYRCEVAL